MRISRLSGVLRRDLSAIPELELGFAASFESRIHHATGMVPADELLASGIVPASVQLPQQTRAREPPRPQVVAKVHQRIELPLGNRHADQPRDFTFSFKHVPGQNYGSPRLIDAGGKRLGRSNPVPIARMVGNPATSVYTWPRNPSDLLINSNPAALNCIDFPS